MWKNEDSSLWFDDGTVVNVRVESEDWQDQAGRGPPVDSEARNSVPYSIEVSINTKYLDQLLMTIGIYHGNWLGVPRLVVTSLCLDR